MATNRKQIKNKSITLINKVNSYDEIFTYVMKIYYDNFINKSIRAITVRIYNFGDDVMYSEYEQLDFFKTDFEQTNL
ncbi:hypothetical protein FACS189459_1050 [Bacilli bacterium]|nr:hypothetical protein FACS189459_1050 [Bacilli bacterium]